MKKESWKVFLACAIGAFIGSLVALEFNHWFWWVGLIAGGVTGYLSYEWRKVAQAIPAAYRAARGWKAPELYWKELFLIFTFIASAYFCAFFWIIFTVILFGGGRVHKIFGITASFLRYNRLFFFRNPSYNTFLT